MREFLGKDYFLLHLSSSTSALLPQIQFGSHALPAGTTILSGCPVSDGIAVGVARVINHFETEAHLIRKGEILVTRATDTGTNRMTVLLRYRHPDETLTLADRFLL